MSRTLLDWLLPKVKTCAHWIRLRSPIARYLYDQCNVAEFAKLSSHEQMLADQARMDAYAAGIVHDTTWRLTWLEPAPGDVLSRLIGRAP